MESELHQVPSCANSHTSHVKNIYFPFQDNHKLHENYKFADDVSVSFETMALGVMFNNELTRKMLKARPKAAIWYATETGSSKR